ncbi:DNA replication/repair protein RecF [Eubacteriales bacterium OttesenSCG-928-N14]|nr:DNA replication/repair protein RecF [Eubacteriales bacterium OttesenSCG-928-N14]
MYITQIQLHNFRNYAELNLAIEPGTDVFYGANAQGKTNVLEAVYLCCLGRSHRTSKYQDMILQGQQMASASVTVKRADGPRTVQVSLSSKGEKRIQVGGIAIKRMAELMGHINCVMFSPEDLQLVKGGPSLRRRYMDTTLCQLQPSYYQALSAYNSALAQRGALLRSMAKRGGDMALLDVFDERLATYGAKLIAARKAFLAELMQPLQQMQAAIAKGERLSISYRTSADMQQEEEIKTALEAALMLGRSDDMRRMETSAGPHRDDIYISIDGKDARVYASQGQQRTAALSMKLALMDIMYRHTGETPVLMLDDVLSELDRNRQRALLGALNGQTLITTATQPPRGIEIAARFYVKEGNVTKR